MGSQAVISGIAQRALAVIHEAAQATGSSQASSNGASSASVSGQDPTSNMGGGSASIFSQGPPGQGTSGSGRGAAADTPAMPSMSGSNTASVYADKFSKTNHKGQNASGSLYETVTGRKKSAASASAPSGMSHNFTAAGQKSGDMGGGSSAIYSQGPSKEGGNSSEEESSTKGSSTPAMPSMSGANTASSYSADSKKGGLTGQGTQQGGSLYEAVTGQAEKPKSGAKTGKPESSSPAPSSSHKAETSGQGHRNPSETFQDPSSSMGGGSSSIFSQGPEGASDSKNSQEGDASTPAMPSMSGTATASSYGNKKPLTGQGRSDSKLSRNPTAASQNIETTSGIPTSSNSGTEDMRGRGPGASAGAAGFDPPPRVQKLITQLKRFMDQHVYPAEHILEEFAADPNTKWTIHPLMDELKVSLQLCCAACVCVSLPSCQHCTTRSASSTVMLGSFCWK